MSVKSGPRKIILSSLYARREEGVAGAAIRPGSLVSITGETNKRKDVVVHATAKGFAPALFASHDEYQGKTIDNAYAQGDVVFMIHALPGDEINALLKDNENIAFGDFLESAGALGELQKYTNGVIIAQAMEANDRRESDASERIKVRIV